MGEGRHPVNNNRCPLPHPALQVPGNRSVDRTYCRCGGKKGFSRGEGNVEYGDREDGFVLASIQSIFQEQRVSR